MQIKLIKINDRGKEQIWETRLENDMIITCHGQVGNTIRQEEKSVNSWKPTNVGKKNERNSLDQAIFETVRKARKKIENGYEVVDGKSYLEEHTSKTVVKSNIDIPKPTLAKNASPYSKDHENSMRKICVQEKVIYQRKLDGNRALINIKTGEIYSRQRKLIISLPHLGEQVIEACLQLPQEVIFVDGELFSSDLTFNEIQSIIRKSKPTSIDNKVAESIKFNIFDYVSDNQQEKRSQFLEFYVKENDHVKIVQSYYDKTDSDTVQKYHDKFVAEGDEGVIIRFLNDGGYQQKRSNFMYKFKNFVDDEYEVIGCYPEKTDENKLGGLYLKDERGEEFNARPSMTVEESTYILNNIDEFIGQMATVRYQKLDDKTGTPIFGTIKGFRAEGDK